MTREHFRRIIVIGLDGATMNLIEPWARQGLLPTFSSLIAEGSSGILRSTIPPATIPAWPSFATGVNPGKHGFFDFFKERPGTYYRTVETRPSLAIKKPTIWAVLSHAKRRVGVIAVPSTYPPLPVNGFLVSGMFTPQSSPFAYPYSFEEELLQRIGEFDFFFRHSSGRRVSRILDDMTMLFDQRTRTLEYLLSKDLDFLMMVDNGTDRGEHEFWRFLDPANPLRNETDVIRFGNPLLKYYQYIDRWLGRFVEGLKEDDLLLLVSDHGQGSLHRVVNLNQILIEEGYMKIRRGLSHRMRHALYQAGIHPAQAYRTLRILGTERAVVDSIQRERMLKWLNTLFFSEGDIDWRHTQAFASGVAGSIKVNLKGREPSGIVTPGSEREELVENLITMLREFRDPERRVRVVNEVWKRENLYHGEFIECAPDLVALPEDKYEFFGMHGFIFSNTVATTFGNSGSHRRNGIFIAYTPNHNISGSRLEFDITDMAPTVIELLGVPVPEHVDGVSRCGLLS